MKVRTCSKCGADNTLRSKKCYNCAAPITAGGKLESLLANSVALVVLGYLAYKYFIG